MAIITDLKARNIKPDSKPLPHGGVPGLTLIPSKTKGHGKWVFRYVSPITGKRRNTGLGSYPEVGIAAAGKAGSEMRVQIQNGTDPLEEKAQKLAQIEFMNSIPTFKESALTLYKDLLPSWRNKRHQDEWISSLNRYVFDTLGKMKLDQIKPVHVADVLRPIWLTKCETAGRVKQRIHAVMAWGWARGFCQSNPVDVVDKLLPVQPNKLVRVVHYPAMPWRLIPEFVAKEVKTENRFDITRSILLFIILTACRSGEARGMQWNEVDFETATWVIPAERMKAKIPHRVPLSHQALELLQTLRPLHEMIVFPSPRKLTVLSDMVVTSFLRKHHAVSDIPDRAATAHGFRSSFRDWCSEKGYPRDLAERALAHTIANQVEAAYHRTDLLEQRRDMMQAWADLICSQGHGLY